MAESQAKAMQIIDSSRIKIKPAAVTTIQQPLSKNLKIQPQQIVWSTNQSAP
jgi:hypothetical protein